MGFCRFLPPDPRGSDIAIGSGGTRTVMGRDAHVAQLVERVLGKDEVISSILIMGSILDAKRT